MLKRALLFAFFGCIVLAASVGGYRLHMISRNRTVEQFQNRQLHAVQVVAATLESEVSGLGRTLRAIASSIAHQGDIRQLPAQLRDQLQCGDPPCFDSAAIYAADGHLQLASPRRVGLPPADVASALRGAAAASAPPPVRLAIARSHSPSLIFTTPTRTGGDPRRSETVLLAAEIGFTTLFDRQEGTAAAWPHETTLVLDLEGNVLYHSRHPEMRLNNVRQRTAACTACHDTFWYVDRMYEQPRGLVRYDAHGMRHLGAFTRVQVEGQTWIAAVLGPAETAVTEIAAHGRNLALVMVATLMALGAAVQISWKDQRRRLQLAAEVTRKAHLERSHAALTALNARLEAAALEWRTTVDTIEDALVVLEPDGSIERMNLAASATLPGEPFSWIAQPSANLSQHPPWNTALRLAREANARNGICTERVSCEASGRTWDLWCRPAQRSGRSTSVLVIVRDVTAVVELQESLRRSETMAALGSLVAGVAHEVRSPLFAISSLLDAWSVNKGNPAPFLEALHTEVQRLSALMHELLEYGTPSRPHPQRYPLAVIVHEALRSCAHEAEARQVRLANEPATDVELWVDPQRFVRVLINVIQNAIQHAPAGTEVTLTTAVRKSGDTSVLHIFVRDCGPGFREDDLPRVFSPFFSRRAGGFGLGLAISGRIVSEHRGRIAAGNHPDGGAVVTISIPLAPPPTATSRSQGAATC